MTCGTVLLKPHIGHINRYCHLNDLFLEVQSVWHLQRILSPENFQLIAAQLTKLKHYFDHILYEKFRAFMIFEILYNNEEALLYRVTRHFY